VKSCLLRREPHLAARESGSCCACQNPMHQFHPSTPPRTKPGHASAGDSPCTVTGHCHGVPPASERPTASQNAMHQFTRPPPPRRPSGPGADIIEALPEPHAPIYPPAAAGPSERVWGSTSSRRCQNPMQQFVRPPRLGRPSGLGVDIVEALPEPHAPIHGPLFRQNNSQGRETPHVQRSVARPARPTVSPEVHMRRW
jgi:hypothetical protein